VLVAVIRLAGGFDPTAGGLDADNLAGTRTEFSGRRRRAIDRASIQP
jgi:hypothetical protein